MSRIPLIAGNWKMHKTLSATRTLLAELRLALRDTDGVEVAVAPPFTALAAAAEALRGSAIRIGAQNMHESEEGAFTGEISPVMLTDLGANFVILGHSERRALFGEGDELINRKVRRALISDLEVVLCIGETLEERRANRTDKVLRKQLEAGLETVKPEEIRRITIAYEPVWAIGTSVVASTDEVASAHAFIRKWVTSKLGEEAAGALRILYGGSVSGDNAAGLMALADVDGLLVGGASLKPDKFIPIIEYDGAR